MTRLGLFASSVAWTRVRRRSIRAVSRSRLCPPCTCALYAKFSVSARTTTGFAQRTVLSIIHPKVEPPILTAKMGQPTAKIEAIFRLDGQHDAQRQACAPASYLVQVYLMGLAAPGLRKSSGTRFPT
jgi:hypothetical protein